ncbi:hypothetical protein BX661DRAFT_178695, partial [Kickxella alabastrina]|uniref:uncharacterized protein n=1 Tax=Kickxella alabastrina TaxID=61397 RepID=UPI00221EA4BA
MSTSATQLLIHRLLPYLLVESTGRRRCLHALSIAMTLVPTLFSFFPALTVALKPLSFFYLPSRDNFMLHTSVAGLQIMLPLPMWLLLLLLLHTNAVDPTI